MFLFSHTFPVSGHSTFPIFWKLPGFLLQGKNSRNPWLWNVCVVPYFSLTMGNHFSHILGIVWISASPKIFEKPNILKCLCFSHTFFLYIMRIHFSHVLGIVWISACASSKIFEKPINLKYLFSHTFPVLWKTTFPMCWELHGFLLHGKNSRNP